MARIVQHFLRTGLLAFMKRDEGLVAVEWIAMSAAVSVGGIAVVWMVMNTLGTTATGMGGNIAGSNSGSCANAALLTTASC